ncbi:ABC transporter permease [Dyadobacter tibetensis]|uniref:ABC transporter permease n=1 Tax=Dyadobacter tibetensis TaxID=1211851 RepID=UPI000472DDDA|nr:ABC transporter permease [Dyadobacter tibetensis]
MKTFIGLLGQEFKRIFSNNVLVAIFFGAPILYGILFGYVYQQAKVLDLPIVVVDQDGSPTSDKIIDALGDTETLEIVSLRKSPEGLAQEMPGMGYAAVVTIPSNFEAELLQKRYPELHVDLNMGNILNANFASKSIQTVLATINAGVEIQGLQKQGYSPERAQQSYEPFKVNFNKLYNSTGNYVTFMLPGLIAGIMQQVIFLAFALVFARDFEDRYFSKLVGVSKSSFYHVFLKVAPFLLFIPIMWTIVGSFFPFFRVEVNVFNPAMLVLVILLSTAAMFIGMLFSILIPSQLKATELLMVISTPAFVLSGFTWPRSAMPAWVDSFAQVIPLTHFLEGFRKIGVYGGTLQDAQQEINALAIITVVSLVLILIFLQLKIRKQERMDAAEAGEAHS